MVDIHHSWQVVRGKPLQKKGEMMMMMMMMMKKLTGHVFFLYASKSSNGFHW